MAERRFSDIFGRLRLWLPIAWLGACAFFLSERWGIIRAFTLSDTDDNMRMMQVRALLAGQHWFDLRQYRLDPPFGADIHWSRLVDLPLAGLMLLLRPILGGADAEKAAAALAPMLPMAVAMIAIALVARRLVDRRALLLAFALLACAHVTRGMWLPMRIDHHGWQLAFLALVLAGLTAPNIRRGGITVGLATAASLVIGLEMLIYLAIAGAIIGLMWVRDGRGERLAAYGIALGGGCAAGFLLFASYANRAPVCDALSPVWLSAMVLAGALCVLLAMLRLRAWPMRLALASVAALVLAGAFVWAWPHCLGRLEGVSPEAQRMWLDKVREARPIYMQSGKTILAFVGLPIVGLIGYGLALWRTRRDPNALIPWVALATLALTSAALLLWQTRAGAAAQLLAIPGVTALAWTLLIVIFRSRHLLVRVGGAFMGFMLVSGLGLQIVGTRFVPAEAGNARTEAIALANRTCPTLAALRPIAHLPKGYVLTFVDLSPRLITVTHHDAVAGPYHRNDDAIVDVMKAFRGTPANAQAMIARRGIDYVLICPNTSESTNYQTQAPDGFYAQLAKDKVPAWLSPVELPKDSPYRIWRVAKSIEKPSAR